MVVDKEMLKVVSLLKAKALRFVILCHHHVLGSSVWGLRLCTNVIDTSGCISFVRIESRNKYIHLGISSESKIGRNTLGVLYYQERQVPELGLPLTGRYIYLLGLDR